MGIQGILPLFKSVQKSCNLKDVRPLTIGIDAYVWLRKGAISSAIELATGQPTSYHLQHSLTSLQLLKRFGITPFLVFSGDCVPNRAADEVRRAEYREQCKRNGLRLLLCDDISRAKRELQKAVAATPYMARELIEKLKRMNIQYVVAPFDASAQLVYLERNQIIDGILSEDSNIIGFGAVRLFSSLDKQGNCVEINRHNFAQSKLVNLSGWTDADFRKMALLCGCDYLKNIGKLGLKSVCDLIRKHKTLENIIQAIQETGRYDVPLGYVEDFKRAEKTFLYHRVYCPMTKRLVTLTTFPYESVTNFDWVLPGIGAYIKPQVAKGIAMGNLDPITKEPIVHADKENAGVVVGRGSVRPANQTDNTILGLEPAVDGSTNNFLKRVPLAELNPNDFTPIRGESQLKVGAGATTWFSSPAAEAAYKASIKILAA